MYNKNNRMAEYNVSDEILISEGMYRLVIDIIQPECIVKRHRLQMCNVETMRNCVSSHKQTMILSGSRGEGFQFEKSDIDCMYIDKNVIVIPSSLPITHNFCNKKRTVLLMENENITPGFAFVKCLSFDYKNKNVYNSLVLRNNDIFLCSKQIRERFMSTSKSIIHGPCQTSTWMKYDRDVAYALKCPFWPSQATYFIDRACNIGWPSYETLNDICEEGCLLVPINSKQQQYSDMMDLEWRISFSLAEKKLIYSMNHCQFLCYGLSKIFFNECLKKVLPKEDDLCSYFMKTAIFWEISHNSSDWVPSNFLLKFWNVFRRLIKWVSTGYCPNFFIPQNNMFLGKICGEKQQTVLNILHELYFEGYTCLLRCSSLKTDLSHLITQPKIAYNDGDVDVPKSRLERQRIQVYFCLETHIDIAKAVNIIQTLVNTLALHAETEEEVSMKRFRVNHILQIYAERLLLSSKFSFNSTSENMVFYKNVRKAQALLYRTKTFFCKNAFIIIKHLYMTGNYQRTIDVIHYTRYKLQSRPFMYSWNLNDDIIMTEFDRGMSFDTLIKSCIVTWVQMDDKTSIEELMSEVNDRVKTAGLSQLGIPPLVYLNFLLFLSYTKLGEYHRLRDVMEELHSIISNDEGYHIKISQKAISWQILGICQQIYGFENDALLSYISSLDDNYNDFNKATIDRIKDLGYR